MNDPSLPLTDDDLSAHLDGEGGPDLAARIADDPVATARLEELRAAAHAVRGATVPPLGADAVDDLLAGALAASDSAPDGRSDPAEHVVTPLAGRRRTGPPWLVAAVVLVLMAVGLGLVWSGTRGSSTDDTASSAGVAERQVDEDTTESAADGDSGGATEGGEATSGGGAAHGSDSPTTAAAEPGLDSADEAADLPDLGPFETPEALRTSLADAFPAAAPTSDATITTSSVDRCAGLLREVLPVEGDPTHVGVAQVGTETVLVYEFTATADPGSTSTTVAGAPATTLTTAVRPAACDPLFVFQR
jgi:hypothetical protein